ncbi:MAG TPA: glycosyl hydrolase [Terrimicrobiaceae bacterium]
MNTQQEIWRKRRRTIGALIAILAAGISAGWNLEFDEENLAVFILQLTTIIALIGRLRAKHPITFRKPPVVMTLPPACVLFLCVLSALCASPAPAMNTLGNLFLPTEPVSIPISAPVTWECRDYFGNTVASGRSIGVIEPGTTKPGYYEIWSGSTLITSFGIVTPFDAPADSAFGVQTHFAQFHDQNVIPLIKKAGIKHIRDEQYWSHIENPKGVFAYPSKFTDYMGKAAANGISPLITLNWANQLYDYEGGQFTGPHTDSGRAGYANYALNVLSKYPRVQSVEAWNEYNGGTFIAGPATANKPIYYKRMLQKVYESIKATRSDVKVVAGATATAAHGFFRDLFAQGALPYCDGVSIHYPGDIELEIEELRQLMGSNPKPIWVTEFSRTEGVTAANRSEAAPYVAQTVARMLSVGVERFFWYLVHDDAGFSLSGLFGASPELRPHAALIAYAVAARQFAGAKYQSPWLTSSSVYALKFSGLSVLWSNHPVSVSLATNSALTVTNIMGESTTVSPAGGKVTLPLTKDVQYVAGPISAVTEINQGLLADSVSGYSNTEGANGWNYGYAVMWPTPVPYTPSAFVPMSWGIFGSYTYRWLLSGGYPYASGSVMHPSGYWAIRRWTSNYDGPATLSGRLSRGAGGDGVCARIFVDGLEVYDQPLSPGESFDYSVPVTLKVGSTVDFTVNCKSELSFDATEFTSQVVKTTPLAVAPAAPTNLRIVSGVSSTQNRKIIIPCASSSF